jgi:hypothetical protein
MDIVNVVMTCRKLADPPPDVPFVEVKNGIEYYFMKYGVVATFFRTGKVKVFSSRYPPPSLPYYGDCRVENVVARTAIPAVPPEELKELLERRGFIVSDREKVNGILVYAPAPLKVVLRIFPRVGVAKYKTNIFAPTPEAAEEAERLLVSVLK